MPWITSPTCAAGDAADAAREAFLAPATDARPAGTRRPPTIRLLGLPAGEGEEALDEAEGIVGGWWCGVWVFSVGDSCGCLEWVVELVVEGVGECEKRSCGLIIWRTFQTIRQHFPTINKVCVVD